jgi:NAD(P)-dependent dehydrogenase (short-subunit alcohol dehydrogenase family)
MAAVFADLPGARFASVDVTTPAACRQAVADCVAEFGRLDILVNVAGFHQMRHTQTMTDDDWERDLAVNLRGRSICVGPVASARGGRQHCQCGIDRRCRGRGLFRGLLRSQARPDRADPGAGREIHQGEVRVNAVCPGGMLTPQVTEFQAPEDPDYDLILCIAAPRGMMDPSTSPKR